MVTGLRKGSSDGSVLLFLFVFSLCFGKLFLTLHAVFHLSASVVFKSKVVLVLNKVKIQENHFALIVGHSVCVSITEAHLSHLNALDVNLLY